MCDKYMSFGYCVIVAITHSSAMTPPRFSSGIISRLTIDHIELIPALRRQRDISTAQINPPNFALLVIPHTKAHMSHRREHWQIQAKLIKLICGGSRRRAERRLKVGGPYGDDEYYGDGQKLQWLTHCRCPTFFCWLY